MRRRARYDGDLFDLRNDLMRAPLCGDEVPGDRLVAWMWAPLLVVLATLALLASPARAHDRWGSGLSVPAWVKRACCGPADVHRLRPDQVRVSPVGWQVDGYHSTIPNGSELPSGDQDFWIFYKNFDDGSQSNVYCFFVPAPGT